MDNRALACISDPALLDDVLRLAAAAGCQVECVPDVVAARRHWQAARLVVLDQPAAAEVRAARLPKHRGIVVVNPDDEIGMLYEHALALGAVHVVKLPAAEDKLVAAFADAAEGSPGRTGQVVAVLGGRGGAGASVFSAALGLGVLRRKANGFLVDCDPHGGGLDLVMGAEEQPGMRWSDLRIQSGRVSAAALRRALPSRRRGKAHLAVLACRRTGPEPVADAVAAVLDAGCRAGDTVICDLPRILGEVELTVLERAAMVVMVVPADVRACAAASGLAGSLAHRGLNLRLVVRGPAPGGLEGADVARMLDLPLLATMRPQPGLTKSLDRGDFRVSPRSPLGLAADKALNVVTAPLAQTPAAA